VAYQVSPAYPLEVPREFWGGFQAAYDVNGDAVDDIIYADTSWEQPQLRLLTSGAPPRSLEFSPTPCRFLEELPGNGRPVWTETPKSFAVPPR